MIKKLLLLSILILTTCWIIYPTNNKYPLSDHFDGTHFHNLDHETAAKGIWDVLLWKLTANPIPWPEFIADNKIPDLTPITNKEKIRITYINHATVLLQWHNLNIITDPAFSEQVGPEYFIKIKRHRAPGIALEQLPHIDIILLSHNHYDHMDNPSLAKIIARDNPKLLVPLGVAQYLPAQKNIKYQELDWWQAIQDPQKGLTVTFVPAQHWSRRTLWDTNKSLWGGFVIKKDGMVLYFAGDTGFGKHFKLIAQHFPKIDLALLPIGAYKPRDFMKPAHMNPNDAVLAAIDLTSKKSLGIHFGTFRLGDEGIDQSITDLNTAVKRNQLATPFEALKNGGTLGLGPKYSPAT